MTAGLDEAGSPAADSHAQVPPRPRTPEAQIIPAFNIPRGCRPMGPDGPLERIPTPEHEARVREILRDRAGREGEADNMPATNHGAGTEFAIVVIVIVMVVAMDEEQA